MYVCVCVHACAVGSAIQDTNQSRLLWGMSVPSPWLVGDNRNFLELRAPEVTVFPGLALLTRKRKEENPVSMWLKYVFLSCDSDPGAQDSAPWLPTICVLLLTYT